MTSRRTSGIWIKLESNRYPFKVKFGEEVVYDLKNEIKRELAPRLDLIPACELVLFPPSQLSADPFQNDLVVAELFSCFGSSFDKPWLLQLPRKPRSNLWPSFQSWILSIDSSTLLDAVRLFIQSHISSLSWFTIFELASFCLEFETFTIASATGVLVILILTGYVYIYYNSDVEEHFISSANNLARERYWTLVTSSFSHCDINHLILNLIYLMIAGPEIERILGLYHTIIFFVISSTFCSLVSIYFNGAPSIGASGSLFAMTGFLMRYYGNDANWIRFVWDSVLFYLALQDERIDHFAHVGGFIFGVEYYRLFDV